MPPTRYVQRVGSPVASSGYVQRVGLRAVSDGYVQLAGSPVAPDGHSRRAGQRCAGQRRAVLRRWLALMGLLLQLVLVACAAEPAGAPGQSGTLQFAGGPDPWGTGDPWGARDPGSAGSTLYVSAQGSDLNPGTRTRPLRSLVRAVPLATPGTLVLVGPGRYPGAVHSRRGGTEQARIQFRAEPPGGARIVSGPGPAAWQNDGDYVDIIGFDISGTATQGILNEGSQVRIVANRVHDLTEGDCIATYNNGYTLNHIDIIDNVVYGCGRDLQDHGIYLGYQYGLIANNIAYGNSGYGIHCWHNCARLTIANNMVFNNGGGIIVGQGDSPHFGAVPADHVWVANNIVLANHVVGIAETGATGRDNRYLHNLVFGNPVELENGQQLETITADPGFVDYRPDGTGDYRLRLDSPARGAGDASVAPRMAIDGTPRPLGGPVDLGPYEH